MKAQSFKLDKGVPDLAKRLSDPGKRQLWKEIKADPQFSTNFLRLGRLLCRDGQHREAMLLYAFAVRKHPHFYPFLLKLGLAFENAGEEFSAIRTYRRIIRRFPDRFLAYLRLEKLYRRSANPEKAIRLYETISDRNPIKERSYRRLFKIHARKGDFEKAIRVLQEAFEKYGESYERCLEMGKLLFRRGDFLGAVQNFESAVAFRSRSLSTRTWLGIALKELGNLKLAEYEFNEILRIKPDSYRGLIHLAELKAQAKKFDEAEKYLRRLEEKSPGNARVSICRGWIALQSGAPEEAISCCQRGLRETLFCFVWEQVLAHRIMTEAFRELGRKEDEEFHRRMAVAIAGKDTFESLIGLAESLCRERNFNIAGRVFERILQLYPRNTRAQIGLGETYLKEGKLEEARLICRQSLERLKPIFIRERIRAHLIIAESYKKEKKPRLYKKEKKAAHALFRQLYLKPKEKSKMTRTIEVEK